MNSTNILTNWTQKRCAAQLDGPSFGFVLSKFIVSLFRENRETFAKKLVSNATLENVMACVCMCVCLKVCVCTYDCECVCKCVCVCVCVKVFVCVSMCMCVCMIVSVCLWVCVCVCVCEGEKKRDRELKFAKETCYELVCLFVGGRKSEWGVKFAKKEDTKCAKRILKNFFPLLDKFKKGSYIPHE